MTKRTIGRTSLLFTAMGGIIGSGWLFGPYYASQIAGPAAILSWVVGGLLMIIIALTFAELSAMLPIVGGIARFSHFSHGTFVSFTMSWCGWISSIVVAPIETMALIQYASAYLPELSKRVGTTHELTGFGVLVAALLMLLMCYLNWLGMKLISRTNSAIVLLKIGVPVFTALIFFFTQFHPENLTAGGFAPYGLKGILTALPAAGVIFSFIGYSTAILLAGESKNPQRNIPFAVIGSILICIVLYVIVQLAFLLAVDPGMLKGGWKSLQFQGDSGPFAGMAMTLGLAWLAMILFVDAAISPFGTALIYTSAAARMNYAMSQNGYMPAFMRKLNDRKSPAVAITANYLLGLLLFLPFPGWQGMVTFLVSAFIISYAVGPVALSSLRKIMPDAKRPFRLPFERLFAVTSFFICNILVFWTGWDTFSKILIAILVGYAYLTLHKFTKEGRKLKLDIASGLWLFPYYIGLGVISYLGTFGGGTGLIPFGWDFLVIFLFSMAIFYLSQISRIKVSKPFEEKTEQLPVI
ncbi:MAG: amino acid permease [Verrucomicrobia bacterium]|nr:amino acid permease [Verrucomicrobiota bacterium]